MKKQSTHSQEMEYPTPEIAARQIRSGYFTYFLPAIVCVATAIFFAIEHDWILSVGFVTSALICIPVALTQYRNDKLICEKVILKYQHWYAQKSNAPDAEDS